MCTYPNKIANIIPIDPFKQFFLWIRDVDNKQAWSGQHTLAFFLLIWGLSLTFIPFLAVYLLGSISKFSFLDHFSSEEPPVSWISNKFLVLFFKNIASNSDICDCSSEFLASCCWNADGGSRKRAFLRPNMRGTPGTCRTVNLSVLLIGRYLFLANYSE